MAKMNFDALENQILDLQDKLYNDCLAIREQVCEFLITRPNNRFVFANEIKEKLHCAVAYRNISRFGMHEAKRVKVAYIEYAPEKSDFLACGWHENELVKISARDLDLDSLYSIVGYLAQYQREQDGTAKTAEQIEREANEMRFGKEYYTNKYYRLYIDTQLEPIERVLLSMYNNTPENEQDFEHLPKRIGFALVLREC
jgi:hypothetical protein